VRATGLWPEASWHAETVPLTGASGQQGYVGASARGGSMRRRPGRNGPERAKGSPGRAAVAGSRRAVRESADGRCGDGSIFGACRAATRVDVLQEVERRLLAAAARVDATARRR
jgi:hypothetical protein